MFSMNESEAQAYRKGRAAAQLEASLVSHLEYRKRIARQRAQATEWTWQDEASRLQSLLLERDAYIVGLERQITKLKNELGNCEQNIDWLKELLGYA